MPWLSIIPKPAEILARRVATRLLLHCAGKARAAFRMGRLLFLSPPLLRPSRRASLPWLASQAHAPRSLKFGFSSGTVCADPALCRENASEFGAKYSCASVPHITASAAGRAAQQPHPEPCSRLRAASAPAGLRIRASALAPESATRTSEVAFGAACLACFQAENTPPGCSRATATCL